MGKPSKNTKSKEVAQDAGCDDLDYDPIKEEWDTTRGKKLKVPIPVQYHRKKSTQENSNPYRHLFDEFERDEEEVEAQLVLGK